MAAKCKLCKKSVYAMDPQINLDGSIFHKPCAKCADCNCQITLSNFTKNESADQTLLLCKIHYFKRFHEGGSYVGGDKYQKSATRDVPHTGAVRRTSFVPSISDPVPIQAPAKVSSVESVFKKVAIAETPAVVEAPTTVPAVHEPVEEPVIEPAVPEVTPAIPEVTPAIPEVTPAIPEVTPAIPEVTPAVEAVLETVSTAEPVVEAVSAPEPEVVVPREDIAPVEENAAEDLPTAAEETVEQQEDDPVTAKTVDQAVDVKDEIGTEEAIAV